ncbi:MAG: tRNA uridine-5-carboxymethylaminomethyl(34) synthesis GTPase MnmE, partial [Desulfobacterales bacterium]
SGPDAVSIATAIFCPIDSKSTANTKKRPPTNEKFSDPLDSHRLYYGHVVDPESDRVLDEVLLSVMKAPRTYTREDVVEINAHGGPVAVHALLELVLKQGARLADPGEFTKRAFLNGRIDLTQAEAVIDIINARTDKSLHLAAAQIDGRLRRQLESIRDYLIELITRIEAAIDFPEDVEEIVDPPATIKGIKSNTVEPLRRLIQHHTEGNVLRDGFKVAVVGRPNVGKSSLLNCLLQKDRAIVTSVPGTTRDTIEETLNMAGLPVIIADTAGLHDTNDPIESIGIEKTLENVNGADLVLFMVEAHVPPTAEDAYIFEKIQSKPYIIVVNKIDLVQGENLPALTSFGLEHRNVHISALYDRGIDLLKQQIVETAFGKDPIAIDERIVPNLRHKLLLEDSLQATETIVSGMNNGIPMELIAIHLQEAIDSLGEILGVTLKPDLLDRIFSRFCIGK